MNASTLHTRGLKPKYWERAGFVDARSDWLRHWREHRRVGQRSAVLWERLAAGVLRARAKPDPLYIAAGKRLGLPDRALRDPGTLLTMLAALGVT